MIIMVIGILKENALPIVSMVPESIARMKKDGHDFLVELGAGERSDFTDAQYADIAEILPREEVLKRAQVLVSVQLPSVEDMTLMQKDAWLITNVELYANEHALDVFTPFSFRVLSMDEIPRTSIAQSMDILSSMASLAGYRAVLLAANHFTRYFPMMITAAGSIKPAKVLVIGAGVAGLQAIATARRLGAQVEAFDVRSAVKEEVQSLGAKFVEVAGAREDSGAGGYAVEQSEEFMQRQQAEVQKRAMQSDIIITTAQIRGRKAPLLVSKKTVEAMRPGSVIVDLASSTGGNCELTRDGEIYEVGGVKIIGNSQLAYEMKQDASLLYGNNVVNFLKYYIQQQEADRAAEDAICKSVQVYPIKD